MHDVASTSWRQCTKRACACVGHTHTCALSNERGKEHYKKGVLGKETRRGARKYAGVLSLKDKKTKGCLPLLFFFSDAVAYVCVCVLCMLVSSRYRCTRSLTETLQSLCPS